MTIEFVDNTNGVIDGAARRRIRRYAALGRNAGKTVVRPSRKKAAGLGVKFPKTVICHSEEVVEGLRDSGTSYDMGLEIERQVGTSLSVTSFPEQRSPEAATLIERTFSFIGGVRHDPQLSNAVDSTVMSTSMWVRFMFLDEAYFHCAVAISATALSSLVLKPEDPKETLYHLSHTFRLLNERLDQRDAVSDMNIAVVVMMTGYELLTGQYDRGLVHLKGLQQMIALRGGISQLTKDKPGFASKIFRNDLRYALRMGSTTQFKLHDIVPNSTIFRLPSSFTELDGRNYLSTMGQHLSPKLKDLLIDFTHFAWMLNDANLGHRPKLESRRFHDTLLVLGYRLIDVSPLSQLRSTEQLENAIYLGLTAFIITLLREVNYKITEIPILSGLAFSAAQENSDSELENQILLWILLLGATSVFKEENDTWLVPKVAWVISCLGLHRWEDISQVLARYPWIGAVHDKAGHALWFKTISYQKQFSESASQLHP